MNKFKFLTHTLFIVAAAFSINAKSFAEPANLSLLKEEIIAYHDNGVYNKEVEFVIEDAKKHIVQRAAENKKTDNPKKLAIILDIDDTSLSSYNKIISRCFTDDPKQIYDDIQAGDLPAIPPVLTLYKVAKDNDVAVFFVTGRSDKLKEATIRNLKNAKYEDWKGIYFRPVDDKRPSVIPYKTDARKTITAKGYVIIASIGDQASDYEGGYTEKGFKLPNPFYYLP